MRFCLPPPVPIFSNIFLGIDDELCLCFFTHPEKGGIGKGGVTKKSAARSRFRLRRWAQSSIHDSLRRFLAPEQVATCSWLADPPSTRPFRYQCSPYKYYALVGGPTRPAACIWLADHPLPSPAPIAVLSAQVFCAGGGSRALLRSAAVAASGSEHFCLSQLIHVRVLFFRVTL